MKSIVINRGAVSILWATSLALSLAIPAITSTPPNRTAPVKVIPKASPPKVSPPATSAPVPNPPSPTSIVPLVAVPTLTPQILKNFPILYGQLLEVKLTPKQQQKIGQRINRDWMTNLGLRSNVMQTLAMEPQILRGTPAVRTQLQAKLVGELRQAVLAGDIDALWLVSFFDAAPKNWLAKGQPPLTRMTTDMSAEALCFMVNEVAGRQIATPDSNLRNSMAIKIANEYANIPPNVKEELARLPANWLRFRDGEWSQRGEDFREQMRIHWGRNLEAYIPEIQQMSKLRAERLARLKADAAAPWDRMNSLQRQAVLQKPDLAFQNGVRLMAQVKPVQLTRYVDRMQVANAVGNSPTRYSVRLKVK